LGKKGLYSEDSARLKDVEMEYAASPNLKLAVTLSPRPWPM